MALEPWLRWLGLRRWLFGSLYRRGMTPWDTNITPPELVRLVEGPPALPPGKALDIGCGTGTNSVFLARRGWDVVGFDFAAPAIERARRKRDAAGTLAGEARFVTADATRMDTLGLPADRDLLFDLGCLHGIPAAGRPAYRAGLERVAAPNAIYLLYAFAPDPRRGMGLSEAEVRELFAPAFALERIEAGTDGARPSAWYWLRRMP